jgi:uncharacterized protein YerC
MRHEGCLPDLPYYVVIVETSHDCCKLHTGTLYHQCITESRAHSSTLGRLLRLLRFGTSRYTELEL